MADRYWVGGTGTWNTTSTTNWSATSGGAGGASVPTATDNVIFDSATTYTVTMTGALTCLDFTVSAGTVTFAQGTSPTLAISGNLSLVAATVWNMSSTVTFNATTSKTIGINNVYLASIVNFNGAAGTWTLTSAAQFYSTTLTNGTFSTSASNYSFTSYEGITIASNSNNKTLSLNGSNVTLAGGNTFINNSTGNFTFNAGTSNITISFSFYTNVSSIESLTFYNVTSTEGNLSETFSSSNSSCVFTFNNLTLGGQTYIGTDKQIKIPANASTTNMVINGTLTMRGSAMAPGSRVILKGQDFNSGNSVQARISAAAVSLVDVDFYCINNTGVSAWTGARLGNMTNNTNITTTTPRTLYYSAATLGQYRSGNPWANTSGGTAAPANNYPLVQDTAIIDNNSGTGTLSLNGSNDEGLFLGTVDMSARTTSMNVSHTAGTAVFFKNYIFSSSVTQQGAKTIQFVGVANSTFNTANVNLTLPIIVAKVNANVNIVGTLTSNQSFTSSLGSLGVLNFGSNTSVQSFTASSGTVNFNGNMTSNQTFTFVSGTLNLNSANITASSVQGNYSTARTINFGNTGKFTTKTWNFGDLTNFSLSGSRTVIINATSSDFGGINHGSGHTNGTEVNAIDLYLVSGNYSFSSYGIKVRDIDFSGYSGTYSIPNSVDAENYFYGNITLSSTMTIGSAPYIYIAAVSGTNYITSNGKSLAPVSFGARGGSATWILLDNAQFNPVNHANGTINLNGKTLTTTGYTTLDGIKNLTFNGGTLSCNGSFNNDKPGGFTVTQGTGTGKISMISASAKNFVGGSNNYSGVVLSQAGAGTLTVSGTNTFEDITNDYSSTGATTITLTAGSRQTVNNFTANGSVGKLLTINSTSGTQATLTKSSGTVSSVYLRLQDNNANGGAFWGATQSTNLGNITGWNLRGPGLISFF